MPFYTFSNDESFIPTLGVFAFGFKSYLSIQQIYAGWARLKHTQSDLENVCALLFKKVNINRLKNLKEKFC